MDVEVTRRQFMTDEYLKIIDAQIFDRDDHVELVEGDVLEMAPVGRSHASRCFVREKRPVVGRGRHRPTCCSSSRCRRRRCGAIATSSCRSMRGRASPRHGSSTSEASASWSIGPRGGEYESVLEVARDGVVAPAAFPDLRVAVDEVFRWAPAESRFSSPSGRAGRARPTHGSLRPPPERSMSPPWPRTSSSKPRWPICSA